MRLRGIRSRRGGVTAVVVVVGILVGAGAGVFATRLLRSPRPSTSHAPAGDTESTLAAQRAALTRAVSFLPGPNTLNVAPDAPVVVSARTGWLTSVSLAAADGRAVDGAYSVTSQQWRSIAALTPASLYRITASIVGDSGLRSSVSSTFRTLAPVTTVGASIFPANGMTVGIAQPVVVTFDHYIESSAARAAVLSHLSITESRPVPGGWHWFNHRELHFRPESYWPVGEHVIVGAHLDGWNVGDGRWGSGAQLTQFMVGSAHIATANLATDRMTVTDNGRVVASYAISGGRPKYPTMNGTHIVMDRESVVHMVSSSVGIPVNSPDGYDEQVFADVHISDSGEYVHAAPWSVTDQGHTNVSHGCINLAPGDALAFFEFSRVGDVVVVTGGPRPPAFGDHGVMDWDTPWIQWTTAQVRPQFPPRPKPIPHGVITSPI